MRYSTLFISCLISIFFPALSLHSQQAEISHTRKNAGLPKDIKFERISLEEGLSQSVVLEIFQDHNGFMWFGTQDGLNKYDGYGFTVYKHSSLDSNSLSASHARALYEDDSKTLWIGTYGGGLNKFDLQTEKFTHYKHDPDNPNSLGDNYIWTFIVDKTGKFWIATEGGGMTKFDPGTEQFTQYRHNPNDPNSLSNDFVRCIFQDHMGTFWIGSGRTRQTLRYRDRRNKIHPLQTRS